MCHKNQSKIYDAVVQTLSDYQERSGLSSRKFGLMVASNQSFMARVQSMRCNLRTLVNAELVARKLWPPS